MNKTMTDIMKKYSALKNKKAATILLTMPQFEELLRQARVRPASAGLATLTMPEFFSKI